MPSRAQIEKTSSGHLVSLLAWVPILVAALAVVRYALARATQVWLANHDIGWFLHAGEVWLDGGTIGVDVIDTNPPLVIWLSGLEVALARRLALTPHVVHAGVTCALALVSAILTGRGLRAVGVPELAVQLFRPLVLGTSALAGGYEFGQRDHWIALLLMPYVSWALAKPAGARQFERASVGALAATAVCLKPHYAAAAGLLELVRALRARSLRPLVRAETVAALAVALLYLGSLPLFAPRYLADLRDTFAVYHAYDNAVPWWSPHTAWLVAALVAVLACLVARRAWIAPLALALAALCGWMIAIVQHKNFNYHHIPTDLFAQAALALAFGLLLSWSIARRTLVASALLLVLGFPIAEAVDSLLIRPTGYRPWAQQRDLFDRHADGGSVMLFSTSVAAVFPAIGFSKARFVSPYSCLWPIPGNYTPAERNAHAFRYRRWEEMTPIERRLLERVTEVLEHERPQLIGFDAARAKQGFGVTDFHFRTYFSAHPRFEPLMQGYERLAVRGRFEYYRRRGG